MKANKVFISAPISLNWSIVTDFETILKKKGFDVKYWDRRTKYDERPLDESDAVVFLLPNNSFKCSESELPIGLRAELSRAYALDKPLFIGYIKSGDGQASFYEADSNGKFIAGQAGTCNSLFEFDFEEECDYLRGDCSGSMNKYDSVYNDLSKWAVKEWEKSNPCAEIPLTKPSKDNKSKSIEMNNFDERLTLML